MVRRSLIAACLALSGADALMTLRGVGDGRALELNPVLSALLVASPLAFVVVKLAASALATLLLVRLAPPRVASVVLLCAAAVYLLASLWWVRLGA